MGSVLGPRRPRDATRTADGGWTWTNEGGITTYLGPPQPMPWWQWAWRVPTVGVYLLMVVVTFPACLAWDMLFSRDERWPHPGDVLGVVLAAITLYTCGGLAIWAWLTGREDWVEVLATGGVILAVCGVLMVWAWIDYRRQSTRG